MISFYHFNPSKSTFAMKIQLGNFPALYFIVLSKGFGY